jgi:uncharacterized membrane protein YfcA
MPLDGFAALAAVVAGGIASVAGFGIGSILTPLLSVQLGTPLAVAAVSVPHLIATLARFWTLRRDVNRRILVTFGILSAAGTLAGALLHAVASSPALTIVFAALLILAGMSAVTGYARKTRFGSAAAWIAGALSGLLGGLVGNQGGIRSAALLGFGLERDAFVATATAIALLVDGARAPVYLITTGRDLLPLTALMAATTVGALAGTFFGTAVLRKIPQKIFDRVVGVLILCLGIFMSVRVATGRS